jgi:drug/metabolite transporter (DMT)-like permease
MAAAAWGAGDFCGGIAARLGSTFVASWVAQAAGLAVALGLLAVAAEPMPGAAALVEATLAGVAGALGLLAFYLALSRGTMGLVAPLTALIAASVPAVIGIASGGSTDPAVLSGMLVALVAVVLITLPERRAEGPSIPMFQGSRARELGLVVVAGLSFATFFLLVDRSHESGGEIWWPLLMTKVGGTASITLVALALAAGKRMPAAHHLRASVGVAVLAGLGDLGGNLFFVMASDVGELASVVVLSSLYPVATTILAWRFLHERLGRVRLTGVALAIAGVVLIGLGSA